MINVKLEGKEIARSVADLFSPLTEFVGTLGDQVRIYRKLTVLRTLEKAKKKAEEENLDLQPPPLRFLIPYLEHASLQEEQDKELNELWTNLILSSAMEYKSEHNLFTRILSELSPQEASAFQYITKSPGSEPYNGFVFCSVEDSWNDSYLYIQIRDLLAQYSKQNIQNIDYADFHDKFLARAQSPGSIIYHFSVGSGEPNKFPYENVYIPNRTDFDDLFDELSFSLLRSHGLIGQFISPEYWFGNLVFDLRAYYLTPLGESFYSSCVNIDT